MRSWVIIAFILISFSANSQTQYSILWENLDGVVTDYANQTLTKTNVDGWGNGGAFSNNTLPGGVDGDVTYTVENEAGTKIFGLSSDDPDSYQTSVEYGFYFSLKKLYIIEDGVIVGLFGKMKAGDVLRIYRYGVRLNYFHNGKLIRQTTCDNTLDMHVDMALYQRGLHFNGATVGFNHDLHVEVDVSLLEVDSSATATLNVTGGVEPYSFHWGSGWVNEATWDSLQLLLPADLDMSLLSYDAVFKSGTANFASGLPGKIEYCVQDSLNSIIQDSVSFGYALQGDSLSGVSVTNNVIERYASNGSPISARLKNGLHYWGSGYIEFSVDSIGDEYHFGFNPINVGPMPPGMLIKNGVFIKGDSLFVSDGVDFTFLSSGLASDDLFRMQANEDDLIFFHNGIEIHSMIFERSVDYILEAHISQKLRKIDVSDINFHGVGKEKAPRIRVYDADCAGGYGAVSVNYQCTGGGIQYQLIPEGSQLTYWTSGNYAYWDNLEAGSYELQITSNNCDLISYDIEVGYKIDWNYEGVALTQGLYPMYSPTIWNVDNVGHEFDAENRLKPFKEGWLEVLLSNSNGSLTGNSWGMSFQDMAGAKRASVSCMAGQLIMSNLDENGDYLPATFYNYGALYSPRKVNVSRVESGIRFSIANNHFETPGDFITHVFEVPQGTNWQMPMLKPNLRMFPGAIVHNARASFECFEPLVQYAELVRKVDHSFYYSVDGKVYWKYDKQYNDLENALKFKVYNEKHEVVLTQMDLPPGHNMTNCQLGHNEFELTLSDFENAFMAGEYYLLEVINLKGESEFLRFLY